MKAFSYLRCSGLSQVEGDTFDRQRDKIAAFAKANDFEVVREFKDEGVSGKKEALDREGLTDLFVAIKTNGIRTVLVENSERLARRLITNEVIIQEFRTLEVKVISCESGADLTIDEDTDPERTLIRQMLAVVAQWERAKLVQRMKAAKLRIRRTTGEKTDGKYPYGVKEGESDVIAKMRALRSEGLSYASIAQRLNDEQIKPRTGAKWHPNPVRRILNRVSK